MGEVYSNLDILANWGFIVPMAKTPNSVFGIVVLCVPSACLNALAMMVFRLMLETPLYFDTVFTVMAAFYGGLVPGVLTGLLTNLVINTVWFAGWGDTSLGYATALRRWSRSCSSAFAPMNWTWGGRIFPRLAGQAGSTGRCAALWRCFCWPLP
jgi:hypothetical protein